MKRVLLKLSGEALAGAKHTGFDEPTVTEVATSGEEEAARRSTVPKQTRSVCWQPL